LTLRQVYSEGAATCALCLLGTSAGPLSLDELIFELNLLAGTRATLQVTGASIGQGDCSGRSRSARA
jgi:urease accessory protein